LSQQAAKSPSSSAWAALRRRLKAATPGRSALSCSSSSSSRSIIWRSRNSGSCTVASSGSVSPRRPSRYRARRLGLFSVW